MKPDDGRSYADITHPLRRLTALNVKFVWNKDCERSFKELKTLLASDRVLANFEIGRDS